MDKVKVSRELLKVARTLAAAGEETSVGFTDADAKKTLANVEKLAEEFKSKHAALLEEIKDAEAKLKEKKDLLSTLFKGWEDRTPFMKARKELLSQAQGLLKVGQRLETAGEGIRIAMRESKQPSYAQQLEILLSMLNEAESKKYEDLLANYFKKSITTLSTGVDKLDDDIKVWHEEAEKIAVERRIKLPKASRLPIAMVNCRLRNAGMWEKFKTMLSGLIPSFIKTVTSWASDLYKAIVDNRDELDELDDMSEELAKQVAKIKK